MIAGADGMRSGGPTVPPISSRDSQTSLADQMEQQDSRSEVGATEQGASGTGEVLESSQEAYEEAVRRGSIMVSRDYAKLFRDQSRNAASCDIEAFLPKNRSLPACPEKVDNELGVLERVCEDPSDAWARRRDTMYWLPKEPSTCIGVLETKDEAGRIKGEPQVYLQVPRRSVELRKAELTGQIRAQLMMLGNDMREYDATLETISTTNRFIELRKKEKVLSKHASFMAIATASAALGVIFGAIVRLPDYIINLRASRLKNKKPVGNSVFNTAKYDRLMESPKGRCTDFVRKFGISSALHDVKMLVPVIAAAFGAAKLFDIAQTAYNKKKLREEIARVRIDTLISTIKVLAKDELFKKATGEGMSDKDAGKYAEEEVAKWEDGVKVVLEEIRKDDKTGSDNEFLFERERERIISELKVFMEYKLSPDVIASMESTVREHFGTDKLSEKIVTRARQLISGGSTMIHGLSKLSLKELEEKLEDIQSVKTGFSAEYLEKAEKVGKVYREQFMAALEGVMTREEMEKLSTSDLVRNGEMVAPYTTQNPDRTNNESTAQTIIGFSIATSFLGERALTIIARMLHVRTPSGAHAILSKLGQQAAEAELLAACAGELAAVPNVEPVAVPNAVDGKTMQRVAEPRYDYTSQPSKSIPNIDPRLWTAIGTALAGLIMLFITRGARPMTPAAMQGGIFTYDDGTGQGEVPYL